MLLSPISNIRLSSTLVLKRDKLNGWLVRFSFYLFIVTIITIELVGLACWQVIYFSQRELQRHFFPYNFHIEELSLKIYRHARQACVKGWSSAHVLLALLWNHRGHFVRCQNGKTCSSFLNRSQHKSCISYAVNPDSKVHWFASIFRVQVNAYYLRWEFVVHAHRKGNGF